MKNIVLIIIAVFLFSTTEGYSQNTNIDYTKAPAEFIYKGIAFYQLPYAYNALEPVIDKETVMIHYDRHHKAYFTKYVDAMENKAELQGKIEDVMKNISKYSDGIRNNAGGYYNHILYWKAMIPGGSNTPNARLSAAINKKFGSFENLKKQLADSSLSRFGSGWAWLAVNKAGDLFISTTANQDNPLMDIIKNQGIPVLGIDVWEHAYYLKYQNKRKDYIDNFWKLVNWDVVAKLYDEALAPLIAD